MASCDPYTVQNFKDEFYRDFTYGDAPDEGDSYDPSVVIDRDIEKAISEAEINFNPNLFGDCKTQNLVFSYLVAHYLVSDMQRATEGLNSSGVQIVNSRSIGSVSESYSVPEELINDPVLGQFATTSYGAKYLGLIKPLLIGGVAVYEGATTPY